MAEPQEKDVRGAATVSECSATDCRYNEDHECQAGEIVIRMQGGEATCGTYTASTPKARP